MRLQCWRKHDNAVLHFSGRAWTPVLADAIAIMKIGSKPKARAIILIGPYPVDREPMPSIARSMPLRS
jgi:hypothetical protein